METHTSIETTVHMRRHILRERTERISNRKTYSPVDTWVSRSTERQLYGQKDIHDVPAIQRTCIPCTAHKEWRTFRTCVRRQVDQCVSESSGVLVSKLAIAIKHGGQ